MLMLWKQLAKSWRKYERTTLHPAYDLYAGCVFSCINLGDMMIKERPIELAYEKTLTGESRWVIGKPKTKRVNFKAGWKRKTVIELIEICELEMSCGHWIRKDFAKKAKNICYKCMGEEI